jgi:chromosome segregation ATPase
VNQPSELEGRVAALETKVSELTEQVKVSRQDAAAARVLAGGADRDVEQIRGEIRDFRQAATSSLNALRETQREQGEVLHTHSELLRTHGELLRTHSEQLRTLDEKVDGLSDKFDRLTGEVRSKFDQLAGGQEQITGLLNTLISQQGE